MGVFLPPEGVKYSLQRPHSLPLTNDYSHSHLDGNSRELLTSSVSNPSSNVSVCVVVMVVDIVIDVFSFLSVCLSVSSCLSFRFCLSQESG